MSKNKTIESSSFHLTPCRQCKFPYNVTVHYLCPFCGAQEISNLFEDNKNNLKFLVSLSLKINSLMSDLNAVGFDSDDPRLHALGGELILNLATYFDLKRYDEDLRYSDSIIPKQILENNPSITHEKIKEIIETYDKIKRGNYLPMLLFMVENLFYLLGGELGYSTNNKSYKGVTKFVIEKLNFTTEQQMIDIFHLPHDIRNTLHENGFYSKENRQYKIETIEFFLCKNTITDFMSWRHLFFYTHHALEALRNILFHQEVLKLNLK